MTKYTRQPLPEEAVTEQERSAVGVSLDVLQLFGEAERMRPSYTSRQVPRKPTLEELEDPRKRLEE